MAFQQPEPDRSRSSASSEQTRIRAPEHTPTNVSDVRMGLILLASMIALGFAGMLAFTTAVSTIPQTIVLVALVSIGLGGFASMLSGKANLTVGKWFKASGLIAALLFILLVLLKSVGLLPKSLNSVVWLPSPVLEFALLEPSPQYPLLMLTERRDAIRVRCIQVAA